MKREDLLQALKLYPEFRCHIQTIKEADRRLFALECLNKLKTIMLEEINDLPSLEYFICAEIYADPDRQLQEIKKFRAKHPYEKIEFKCGGD